MSALDAADARTLMQKNGATPSPESPAEFSAFMQAERKRIADVGRQAGISLH